MPGKGDKQWSWRSTARNLVQLLDHRRELGFALLFLVIFAGLFSLYSTARGTAVERLLIDVCTVKPSAALIGLITPSEQVVAVDHRLVSPQARLSILNGCEGIETMLLLVSAILAYAIPWGAKFLGALAGILLVYGLNQVRIVALYYAFRHDRELFDLLHGYVAPVILIVAGGLYFLWWIARQTPPRAAAPATS